MEKLAVYNQKAARSGCTGLSGGAPDSVRCARLALVKRPLSGFRRRHTTINHWTVRWCTGLSAEPTVGQANGRPRNPRASVAEPTVRKGHRTVRCAPHSVRCANGSESPTVGFAKEGKKSAPDSVRWCTGLSGGAGDRRQELPSWNALNGS
jgi:hypothetical protein